MFTSPLRSLSLALLLAGSFAAPALAQETPPVDTAWVTPRMPVPRVALRTDRMDSMVARLRRQAVRRIDAVTLYFPQRRAQSEPLGRVLFGGEAPSDTTALAPREERAAETEATPAREGDAEAAAAGGEADRSEAEAVADTDAWGERPAHAFTLAQEARLLDNQADRLRRRAADLLAEAERIEQGGEEQRAAVVAEQGRLLEDQSRQLRAHAFRLRQRAQALGSQGIGEE